MSFINTSFASSLILYLLTSNNTPESSFIIILFASIGGTAGIGLRVGSLPAFSRGSASTIIFSPLTLISAFPLPSLYILISKISFLYEPEPTPLFLIMTSPVL